MFVKPSQDVLLPAPGTAIHVHRGSVDVGGTGAVAVTWENEGGADQPTMPIVAVAALQ